jgi:uncharacterized protein YndB with AHSA1/START domain
MAMAEDFIAATTTIEAPAQTVFDVLADPAAHAAIDGTGWVGKPRTDTPLSGTGQIFRMAMYHENHPDQHYETANRVEAFDPPRAIAWKTGSAPGAPTSEGTPDDELTYGGWVWRYDLAPVGDDRTDVTLTYDWSAVPPELRELIGFPMFDPSHLDNSLRHLAGLAQAR